MFVICNFFIVIFIHVLINSYCIKTVRLDSWYSLGRPYCSLKLQFASSLMQHMHFLMVNVSDNELISLCLCRARHSVIYLFLNVFVIIHFQCKHANGQRRNACVFGRTRGPPGGS